MAKGATEGSSLLPPDAEPTPSCVREDKPLRRLIVAACAATNSCNVGYDLGIASCVGRGMQETWDLSDVEIALFIGSVNICAIFGTIGAAYITDRAGRRLAFACANITLILGAGFVTIAPSFIGVLIGRVIMGIGVGVGFAVDPLYIAETSTPSQRGRLVTCSEFGLNVGIVTGFAVGWLCHGAFPPDVAWRWMSAYGMALPVLMLILCATVLPESPRWLLMKGRREEALATLNRLGFASMDRDALVASFEHGMEVEREAAKSANGWSMILSPTPTMRRILMAGIGMATVQQMCGIDAVQYYMLFLLDALNVDDPEAWQVVFGLIKLFPILIAGIVFDSWGRRPVLILTTIGTTLSLGLISASFYLAPIGPDPLQNTTTTQEKASDYNVLALIGMAGFYYNFSMGLGPGAWLIPSEIYPMLARGRLMAISTCINRAVAAIYATGFLPFSKAVGSGAAVLFLAISNALIVVFIYFLVPETKGRSLDDMYAYFMELTEDRTSDTKDMLKKTKALEQTLEPGVDLLKVDLLNDQRADLAKSKAPYGSA